uniref:Tripartite motif-containing protein 2 n=1 Tax=Heterorhabditis bacteriophora TaxID=37862 RepID=A0A1I7XT29_HETBA
MSEIVVYRAKGQLRVLDQAHASVTQEIDHLDKNVDRIVDQINGTFQEVSNIVENRRRDLIESVRVRRDEKRKVLKDQIENIADEKKKLAKELESCQVDVRSMVHQMKTIDEGWERQLIQPRENAFLRLNTNSSQLICDVQRCLSDFGSLAASTTFPGKSIITQLEPAATYTETKLLVKTFDLDGRPRTSGGDPLDVALHKDNSAHVISINDLNDGTYELTFRVQDAGEYIVTVDIFGRPIKNSPFLINVSSHHSPRWQLNVELHQPVKVALDGQHVLYVLDTGNNRGPSDVFRSIKGIYYNIHKYQNMASAYRIHSVRIVKDSDEVISDVTSPCLEGGTAVGMALLAGGEIAILNWRTKSITRISSKGEEIQSIDFSEFNEPIDLAVDRRGRYLIADGQKIFVFDPNLRPQFSFPTKQQTVTCVNVGLDDDILVGTTHGLLLFDGAGRHLRAISVAPPDHKGRMMVSTCAVCSESGLVISGVVDAKTNKVVLAISRYKGSFIFYMDSHGYRLRRPCGICIASGARAGQCLIVDHASNSVRMYKYK